MDKEAILKLLATVKDPQTGRDIVAAGMVENLEITGDNVNFTLAVPSLALM